MLMQRNALLTPRSQSAGDHVEDGGTDLQVKQPVLVLGRYARTRASGSTRGMVLAICGGLEVVWVDERGVVRWLENCLVSWE